VLTIPELSKLSNPRVQPTGRSGAESRAGGAQLERAMAVAKLGDGLHTSSLLP
jgi:hypothetical protein